MESPNAKPRRYFASSKNVMTKSNTGGGTTTGVEVVSLGKHGFWLNVDGRGKEPRRFVPHLHLAAAESRRSRVRRDPHVKRASETGSRGSPAIRTWSSEPEKDVTAFRLGAERASLVVSGHGSADPAARSRGRIHELSMQRSAGIAFAMNRRQRLQHPAEDVDAAIQGDAEERVAFERLSALLHERRDSAGAPEA